VISERAKCRRVQGPRWPSHTDAPEIFRLAFIPLVMKGMPATVVDLNTFELLPRSFDLFFEQATEGVGGRISASERGHADTA
jgi:hypothetical protein